jgi:hypothetical protein
VGGDVRIVEADATDYTTSFKDSATNPASPNETGGDTGIREIEAGVSPAPPPPRTFDFFNARNTVVPAGFDLEDGDIFTISIMMMIFALTAVVIRTIRVYRRGVG